MNLPLAERTEIESLATVTLFAPADLAERLGLHLVLDGGALMTLAASADVLALNRIVGLGVARPATREQLARLVRAARERGVRRLFVQLAPEHAPAELPAWIAAEGGVPRNQWVRLWRRTTGLPDVRTPLRIAPLDATHAAGFGALVAEAFGMPAELAPWLAALVGCPGWRHFGAFDGDTLAGVAALYLSRDAAWLGFAGTRPDYRGRGVQGALIRRRLEAAHEAGREWAITETVAPSPDFPAQSWRNMLRCGFEEGYRRENYVIEVRG